MTETSMKVAGIDIAKQWLDIAINGVSRTWRLANDAKGLHQLLVLLRRHKVGRVGLEASGGYERKAVRALRHAGVPVAVLQPVQVRAYARFLLCHAKTDVIDARLIARCTAERDSLKTPPDPRLEALAQRLTFLEQTEEDIARLKVRREHVEAADLNAMLEDDIARLKARRARLVAELLAALRRHGDLAQRLGLVMSIDGIAERTAICLIIRMPELGQLSREQAAALAGLAPFPCDSGTRRGERHIAGGRARLRKSLYAATVAAAFRWNPLLIQLYQRLIGRGKKPKLALVACARKLLVIANTVLARGTPWLKQSTPA
jgi:transposase